MLQRDSSTQAARPAQDGGTRAQQEGRERELVLVARGPDPWVRARLDGTTSAACWTATVVLCVLVYGFYSLLFYVYTLSIP